ncbi:hypothetical protein DTO271D3_5846 [Paecilomyces variotii]|nr:hypothetical protein DTO271D3_5846 [Paecilomyces variotii]
MSRKTKALVLPRIGGSFELQEIYLDEVRPDEALVEIYATGLCHTDISSMKGILPCSPPAVLGHEGAGVVIETGSALKTVSKGDKVLLSFSHCQECGQCTSGHPAYCSDWNARNFGGKRADGSAAMRAGDGKTPIFSTFFGQSSFSQLALVHKSCMVKVPPETDLALFAPLGCGIQTGAGAVLNTLDVQPGTTVAVFGVGAVGMSAIMAAKIRRAKTIIAVDLNEQRLALAKRLGATHGVVGSAPDVVDQIKKLSPPAGVDFGVDCTGVPKVVRTMIDSLGVRGKAATVGAPGPGVEATVEVLSHLIMGKSYIGCCEGDSNPSEFIPYLIEQHNKGQFPLEELVTFYDITDHEKAIRDTQQGTALKAVLKWRDAGNKKARLG